MVRKATTRPKVGTVVLHLNTFWEHDGSRPYYRGNIRVNEVEMEISLWVAEHVPGTPVPMRLSGEISAKKKP